MLTDSVAFPTLSDSQLAVLNRYGTHELIEPGVHLFTAGDNSYDFFVVIDGRVDIVSNFDDEEILINHHDNGRFLGELNLLTGQRVFLTARVAVPSQILRIPATEFRRMINAEPTVSDTLLNAFIARHTMLMTGASEALKVVGSRFSPSSLSIREYLGRNQIPHHWIDVETDSDVEALLCGFGVKPDELPVVITGDAVMKKATSGEVASYLGLTIESIEARCFDVVVVGAGPAGLAASVYGSSEGLSTLTIDAFSIGGQAGSSSRIENYLGFPAGLSGTELANRAMVQARKFGANLTTPCKATSLREEAGHLVVTLSDGTDVAGRAVVVATGAQYRKLPIPDLEAFEGAGVYYAATEIEANVCNGKPLVVVGAGNSAGQAAIFLADSGSRVTLVARRSALDATMSRYLVSRIESHEHINVHCETEVVALEGHDSLEGVVLETRAGEKIPMACAGLFSFIGAAPTTAWLGNKAATDDKGFLLTDRSIDKNDLDEMWTALDRAPLPFETSYPGLFAVGDVRSGSMKRVASAVGEGSAAIRSVHEHLAFAT